MGGSSEPSIVSGALAARVRENKAVCLTAIGGEAVSKTIRAICHARLYLEVCVRSDCGGCYHLTAISSVEVSRVMRL